MRYQTTLQPCWAAVALCAAALLPAPDTAIAAQHWVFFRSKGVEDAAELQRLEHDWPARSLKRRSLEGAGVDRRDLPINPEFLSIISEICGKPRVVSRWLNAASVSVDDGGLTAIQSLPFVLSTRPVATLHRDAATVVSIQEETSSSPAAGIGWYGQSWFQAFQIRAGEAHRRGLTGRGVLLGAMDTGFHFTHRAFAGMDLVAQRDFIWNDDDPSWDPRTDRPGQANHGTACLSVIVGHDPGYLVGIAPEVSVAVAKTELTGSETAVEEDWWVAGIEWLEWLGAEVVTSSLTYRDWYRASDFDGWTSPASRAAQRAAELGVVICVSAGNAGPGEVTIGAPSDALGVLAVAAVDTSGQATRFSSRGPSSDGRVKPDVAALGRGVVCVAPMTWGDYAKWNGTSLACPLVAGVAALIREAHPDWSAAKVVQAMRWTAGQAFHADFELGYGLVDCVRALDYPSVSGRLLFSGSYQPAQGFSLRIIGGSGHWSAKTDHRGWFIFPNLPDGSYRLEMDAVGWGFAAATENRNLPPSTVGDVMVKPAD